jgi:hypothetical protein
LREELRLKVIENRVLRRVFGPKRDEVTGEWRKLHNEEMKGLYSLPNIVRVVKSRRMRGAEHVGRMGEEREVHRVLVGKPEEKRPLGRPRRRWVLGYFRYVDDILLVYSTEETDMHIALDSFNKANTNLQFTIEEELENRIDFLDIAITKEKQHSVNDRYRKPTATRCIIPRQSCHPHEHKPCAIRYLRNRNETYPTEEQNKQNERHIIEHTLGNNNYDPTTLNTYKIKRTRHEERPQQQKWTKVTYMGNET